jgi:predicted DCC family thiol-disulfide oxidoreductase YuxK
MKVVYFDGYCNVCNRFVDFLLRNTKELKFASLQGSTAEKRLARELTEDVQTMAFEEDGKVYIESSAAIRSMAYVFKPFLIFLLVPPFIRDRVYRWVANHRYLWFGKRETCRIATPEERERLLD